MRYLSILLIAGLAGCSATPHITWTTTAPPNSICVATAVLKTDSKCSFTTCKLRFFAGFCLALTASKTKINGLLAMFRNIYPLQ